VVALAAVEARAATVANAATAVKERMALEFMMGPFSE
jgi:hypothetical protein